MLLSRGRRLPFQVASESRKIGAFIHDDYPLIDHQGKGKPCAAQVLLKILTFSQSPVDYVDYEGLQLDTRARDNRDPQLDESNRHGSYPDEKGPHAGVPVGVPMGIPLSPDGTLSPMSPTEPKELDEGLESAPPPEKRICGLRRKHFWELLGLILALVLAAAIIGGVVGGLQARNGKNSSSGQPAANNGTNNTTNGANNTGAIPLQYVHI